MSTENIPKRKLPDSGDKKKKRAFVKVNKINKFEFQHIYKFYAFNS